MWFPFAFAVCLGPSVLSPANSPQQAHCSWSCFHFTQAFSRLLNLGCFCPLLNYFISVSLLTSRQLFPSLCILRAYSMLWRSWCRWINRLDSEVSRLWEEPNEFPQSYSEYLGRCTQIAMAALRIWLILPEWLEKIGQSNWHLSCSFKGGGKGRSKDWEE